MSLQNIYIILFWRFSPYEAEQWLQRMEFQERVENEDIHIVKLMKKPINSILEAV